jgi:hypothetical protein
MARDIVLQSPAGTKVATNPHGLAQVGRWVYIIDYDSKKIVIMDPNELNGLSDGETCVLERAPFDLSSIFEDYDIANPRGWGIIALPEVDGTTVKNHLYALFINTDTLATAYGDSLLIRLNVAADGSLSVDSYESDDSDDPVPAVVTVDMNAQEIIPVAKTGGAPQLLIPAIGGRQRGGFTNGASSTLMSIPAFGSWANGVTYLLTGDSDTTKGTYDIRVLGASDLPDDDGDVYILTGYFNTEYSTSTQKISTQNQ